MVIPRSVTYITIVTALIEAMSWKFITSFLLKTWLINVVRSVIAGKSQTEAFMYWPSDSEINKLFIILPF